jgi:hypothetical protein
MSREGTKAVEAIGMQIATKKRTEEDRTFVFPILALTLLLVSVAKNAEPSMTAPKTLPPIAFARLLYWKEKLKINSNFEAEA